MDYARKIGKTNEPKKWTRQRACILNLSDKAFAANQTFTEDRPLVNWKRWLANRRKHHKHIASSTGRHPTDQTLNACETVRPLIEMRELIDHASILEPVLSANVRAVPKFWRPLQALSDHGDPCLPIVTVAQTKKELNEPELTYVDLPKLIEREKDIVCSKSKIPLWRKSQYLARRKCQLSEEIDFLLPKEPETRHLVIEGHGFAKPKARPRRVPVITLSDALLEKDEEEETCHPEELQDQAIVLRIEDREIVWEKCACELGPADPIVWNVSFSSQRNKRAEKEIRLENKGNRVILYQWRNAVSLPATLPLKRRVSAFFFNKTKGVILPGQIVKLKFWYLPRICGVSSELWRFKTDPELCPSPLIFRLSGCADSVSDGQVNGSRWRDDVDGYLDRCIRDSTIREIITEIIENMDAVHVNLPEPFYGTLFIESEIFLAKNPLCFYQPALVTEFHKLYYAATSQQEQPWNLCIEHLRETLLRITHPESRQTMLSQFSQLYKECLKPTLSVPDKYTKHEMVYNLICSFLNSFEQESEHARGACLGKEPKEVSAKLSELVKIKLSTSQVTIKSSSSRNKRRRRSSSRPQISQVQETVRYTYLESDENVYKEVFFIRVYELLGAMMEQVAATIDSFNNLNERDK